MYLIGEVDTKKTSLKADNFLKSINVILLLNDPEKEESREITEAISKLSILSQQILAKRYLSVNKMFDIDIADDLCMSSSSYYRRLKTAQNEFAEAYRAGEMLVFKS